MPKTDTTKTGRERLAEERARAARAERNRKIGIILAVVVALALVAGGGFALVQSQSGDDTKPTDSLAGSTVINSPVKGVRQWTNLSRDHTNAEQKYPMNPPVGGAHHPAWSTCGIYDKEIPNNHTVHSLEHGAVWITTNDKVSAGDIATLKKVASQDYMIMSKVPSQSSPIVLSAWGLQLRVDKASDPRIQQFVKAYLQGPQTPEPGAACSGAYDPATGKTGGQM